MFEIILDASFGRDPYSDLIYYIDLKNNLNIIIEVRK